MQGVGDRSWPPRLLWLGMADVAEYIEVLVVEGERFAAAAAAAEGDAPVPTCPGWSVRQLVQHVGAVHRWAARIVGGQLESRPEFAVADEAAMAPMDDRLLGWFVDGHRALVDVLSSCSPDRDFWRFMRVAPSSLDFWARRQAHETTVHRMDAEAATNRPSEPVVAWFAADGVDELLVGFAPRQPRRLGVEHTMDLMATDVPGTWRVSFGPGGVTVLSDDGGDSPELMVQGPVEQLYRVLWNRVGSVPAGVAMRGDVSVLTEWRLAVAVG